MTIYAIQIFEISTNGTSYELVADIPAGVGRTALLFVHGVRTAAVEYELSAGEGWQPVGAVSATTTNRRFVTAAFARAEPAAGLLRIAVSASRPLAGLVAFLCLVDLPPDVAAVAVAAGNDPELAAAGPFAGPVVYAASARTGGRIEAGTGVILARAETQETDTTTTVVAALGATEDVDAAVVTDERGRLVTLLAVPLVAVPDEPEPPPTPELPAREISVIVRDIPPGGSHEVRHVAPGNIVMGPGGIDWEQTPYTAYILAREEDVQSAA